MKSSGYFIDLYDAECAISVTPNDGTILLHEGTGLGRFHGTCIPGSKVSHFETNRINGAFGIRIAYTTRSGLQYHNIGITDESEQAKIQAVAWVDAVNKIYVSQDNKKKKMTENFCVGRFSSSPVIHDIIEQRKNIVLPGNYLYSRERRSLVYPTTWNAFKRKFPFYAAYCTFAIEQLQEFTKQFGPIDFICKQPPKHDFTWLSRCIDYNQENFEQRCTQPLELIFKCEERSKNIDVIPFSEVKRFAVLYWKKREPAKRLQLKPDDAISSFDEWIKCLSNTDAQQNRIFVATPGFQSVDYVVKDAIANQLLNYEQHMSGSELAVADYVFKNANNAIVACDIGVAYQILNLLQTQYGVAFSELGLSFVPYKKPVSVGFAYRVDDPDWGMICQRALSKAFSDSREEVQENLHAMKTQAENIGMTLLKTAS